MMRGMMFGELDFAIRGYTLDLDSVAPKYPYLAISVDFEVDHHPGDPEERIFFTTSMRIFDGHFCDMLNDFITDVLDSPR